MHIVKWKKQEKCEGLGLVLLVRHFQTRPGINLLQQPPNTVIKHCQTYIHLSGTQPDSSNEFGGNKRQMELQGLKQKTILSLNFFPGWGFGAGLDTYAGLFGKQQQKKNIIWMIFLETN